MRGLWSCSRQLVQRTTSTAWSTCSKCAHFCLARKVEVGAEPEICEIPADLQDRGRIPREVVWRPLQSLTKNSWRSTYGEELTLEEIKGAIRKMVINSEIYSCVLRYRIP